ncbi:hypothetical protein ACVW1A_002798 [Bradyrhizobium sp. LB1.3]
MDAAVLDLLSEIAAELDRAQLDRTVGFIVAADELRHLLEHRLLRHLLRGQLFRRRHVGHLVLVVERALLLGMERHHDREDRVAVLDRGDAARRVALAVAQALDLVDDRDLRIARQDEIAVQRMRQPALHGAAGRNHRLSDHLAAEHPLPAGLGAVAAEQVHLELFEVEDRNEVDQAFGHGGAFKMPRHSGLVLVRAPE